MKIIYEPHPVSPERKAELVGQGFKIIDARFDPNPVKEVDEITEMSAKDVREVAEMHGLETKGVKLADLREQVRRAMYLNV